MEIFSPDSWFQITVLLLITVQYPPIICVRSYIFPHSTQGLQHKYSLQVCISFQQYSQLERSVREHTRHTQITERGKLESTSVLVHPLGGKLSNVSAYPLPMNG